ncbi:tRNA1(Val) (adenine(37)-N6)-methyltransferase [Dokdonia pacifica]|uniref:tRNA1(Val) (adenine(37)-N6)-methyltransferase n=1 Tax=Dokdonia pacifica TaxID=1627892 RepID=A0A238VY87_9FLAO|nr:methyltransferase [Dokdonia pacifica]GGG16629.1 tRNA1(Val) (adenine(37)-N6)-methyltransferase [Dokdonia pacifica]SNR39097.1 tRNA1Val (adenine37-N6)-methyltransferase [Dokdonia pacifica]
MAQKPFQFKQFTVTQDRCAAKIGTDGVLLGAWTSIDHTPGSILDIGTGTGVIALMLAQRSFAETIDALELDDDAYEQATENFENSDWGDRLFCYHAHLYEFATEIDDTYDLIVSNPPFYEAAAAPEGDNELAASRKKARFEDAMPFELLIGAVSKLLSETGTFNVIIPHHREEDFIALASQAHLFPTRITHVKGTPDSPIKRSMIAFQRLEQIPHDIEGGFIRFRESVLPQELIIEYGRHEYTDAYTELVKDFYLKM